MTAIYVEGMLEQARSVDGFFSAYPSVLNCLTNSRYIIFVLLTGTYITSYLIVAITCNIFLSPIVMQGRSVLQSLGVLSFLEGIVPLLCCNSES